MSMTAEQSIDPNGQAEIFGREPRPGEVYVRIGSLPVMTGLAEAQRLQEWANRSGFEFSAPEMPADEEAAEA
jgi:hypothetical protein